MLISHWSSNITSLLEEQFCWINIREWRGCGLTWTHGCQGDVLTDVSQRPRKAEIVVYASL